MYNKNKSPVCLIEVAEQRNFDSKSLSIRVQKKLLGKMATKKIVKVFIDDTSSRVLDNLYQVSKEWSGSKKVAEKVLKDMIKIVIKISVLYRNDQFNKEELHQAELFKRKFQTLVMTVISFYEVEFSFDRNYMSCTLNECSEMLHKLVQRHLTDKSLMRIDNVCNFFGNIDFLDSLFRTDGELRHLLGQMVEDLHKMIDDGVL